MEAVGGDTIITDLITNSATELTINAGADVEITNDLSVALESIDASGVMGELTATLDLPSSELGLDFVGAAGATDLNIESAGVDDIDSISGEG
jgi:hypothetical protein